MKVNSLSIQNYRNIENMEIIPCDGVNIIYGENAQGKTNLLEALWLFTGCRSFRGSKEKELIKFGNTFSKIKMEFYNDSRDQFAEIEISDKKKANLGGIEYDSCTKLFGEFLGIVFAPVHLNLVKGGPVERRKFINMALCQLKPRYSNVLSEYNRVLAQRNILLKDISYHSELLDTLDIWDDKFSTLSAAIIIQRMKYLEEIKPFIDEFYGGLSGGKEKIGLSYEASLSFNNDLNNSLKDITIDSLKEEIYKELQNKRQEDLIQGITTVGPHRDDILIDIDGLSAKSFGSQGQQRSCALSLKLSEAAVIKKITGKQPVALLDDVMSELDTSRQDYILNHIDGWQVFITCCDPSGILRSKSGKVFEIKEGRLCSCT